MHTIAKNTEKKSTDEDHGQPKGYAESQEVENPLQQLFFLMLVVVLILTMRNRLESTMVYILKRKTNLKVNTYNSLEFM